MYHCSRNSGSFGSRSGRRLFACGPLIGTPRFTRAASHSALLKPRLSRW